MDHTVSASDALDLLDYRRRVAEIYRDVRESPVGERTWSRWANARNDLFATHPQSAIDPEQRASFDGLKYFAYDPTWRFEAVVEDLAGAALDIGHSGEGTTAFSPFGRVLLKIGGSETTITLYWLNAYGGGVFVPFRDRTSGEETYGGGRYLLDTVKGADLGHGDKRIVLDFNYSYHPSCVHNYRWSCPLAPRENWLDTSITAGERL